jgi:hypothetical protein
MPLRAAAPISKKQAGPNIAANNNTPPARLNFSRRMNQIAEAGIKAKAI